MTRDPNLLATLSSCKGGTIIFEDNSRGKIIGSEFIGEESSSILEDVLLVVGLKANLISVSELCDKELDILFRSSKCISIDSRCNILLKLIEIKIRTLLICMNYLTKVLSV